MSCRQSGSSGVSGFAAAAKVLFDSAKKVGAVEPLGVTSKLYAQQLKKMQAQSKKKGGSLGSVSYKVAEFLATQRNPKPNILRGSTSIAKLVPLIDIPAQRPNKNKSAAAAAVVEKPHTGKVPLLDFVTKKESPQPVQTAKVKDTMLTSPEALQAESLLTERVVPSLGFVTEKVKEQVVSLNEVKTVEIAEQDGKNDVANARIEEDRPLFENSGAPELAKSSLFTGQDVRTSFSKVVQIPKKTARPAVAMQISTELASSSLQQAELPSSGMMSVDVWEMQREREIEQLRKTQERAERERLAIEREEENKALGDKWVQQRTLATTLPRHIDAAGTVVEKMYFSSDWKMCLQYFEELVSMPVSSVIFLKHAVRVLEKQLKNVPVEYRESVRLMLLNELKRRKLDDEVSKFELRHQQGDTFIQLYRSAPSVVKESLDFPTVLKALPALVGAGFWEEALGLVNDSQQRFTDKAGLLELRLLASTRSLDLEATKAVMEYVAKTLTASERFGKAHQLQMAKMEKGARRRQMILQLINSSHVDEEVYAELLRVTQKENVSDVLEEVRKRGLNAEDPAILAVLCWKSFDEDNPHLLFQEISRQEAITGIRFAHVLIAIAMARASKTRETLRLTVDLVKKAPIARAKFTLRKLLPLLHENNMRKEIVELADLYKDHVPIATALPHAVAFINDALRAEGRPPLSDQTVSSLQQLRENADRTTSDSTALFQGTLGLEISSEAMLQCAKERDWSKALLLINSISSEFAKSTDADTLTLLYNCALSASVEKADLTTSIYSLMLERGVSINATTNNAVLSSLMRSGRSQHAINFYKQIDPGLRDNNTYSVMISLYGKVGMWEEALGLIQSARGKSAKLPPILYTLGINAVQNYNWSATLLLFQTLLKEHGRHVIKDTVVDKVVSCLVQNKRTGQLQKLEAALEKMKKKPV